MDGLAFESWSSEPRSDASVSRTCGSGCVNVSFHWNQVSELLLIDFGLLQTVLDS